MPSGDFMDVTLGNRRRKALLQRLLAQYQTNQYQTNASPGRGNWTRSTNPVHAFPLWGGMRRARAEGDLPAAPIPQLTVPFPISPGLIDRLGPGGSGTPGQGNFSPGPGVPALGGKAQASPYPGAGWGNSTPTGSPTQNPTMAAPAVVPVGGSIRRLYSSPDPTMAMLFSILGRNLRG